MNPSTNGATLQDPSRVSALTKELTTKESTTKPAKGKKSLVRWLALPLVILVVVTGVWCWLYSSQVALTQAKASFEQAKAQFAHSQAQLVQTGAQLKQARAQAEAAKAQRDNSLQNFQSVTPAFPPANVAGAFGNLVLVSWLEDAGKDVIYVENTETNDVQKITSEPNLENFRIVELHPSADPKLFEAIISNGSQQGPVRFHF
jgi:hypothetical protein